jgi:hypothetical protein
MKIVLNYFFADINRNKNGKNNLGFYSRNKQEKTKFA